MIKIRIDFSSASVDKTYLYVVTMDFADALAFANDVLMLEKDYIFFQISLQVDNVDFPSAYTS